MSLAARGRRLRCVVTGLVASGLVLVSGCSARQRPAPSEQGPELVRLDAPPGVVVERACSPSGPERCFDARDDNCNGVIDEGCGTRTGLVQFVIAWNEAATDVDLEVTDPNGELVEVGRVAESGLVKERDCPGSSSECHGQNLENVYLEEGDLVRGTYRVRVRLDKLGSESPPIRVTFGARVGPKTYAAALELSRAGDERILSFEL